MHRILFVPTVVRHTLTGVVLLVLYGSLYGYLVIEREIWRLSSTPARSSQPCPDFPSEGVGRCLPAARGGAL